MTNIDDIKLGGARQKNGHKLNCTCHICMNMKNKAHRGGYTADAEKQMEGGSKKKNGHRAKCACPICKNMQKKTHHRGGAVEEEEPVEEDEDADAMVGGKSKRRKRSRISSRKSSRKRKGNGHKPTCKCPICKNMRKSKQYTTTKRRRP